MSWTEPRRVTVLGNPGLDTLVLLDVDEPDLGVDGHFVRTVDTVGHAAAYCARGFARLGNTTRVLGSTGRDPAGEMVRRVLAAEGIDTSLLFTDPAGTARSVNLVRPDGRRTYFYDGAGHMTLTPPPAAVQSALADTDLVVSTLANWARHVVVGARARGVPVAVDLQDVRDPADPYRADFVANADLLFASAAHLPDPIAAALAWFAAGPAALVVLGMGALGAMVVQRGPEGPIVTRSSPPALDLPVVDTTGAGDSLAVGFLDAHVLAGRPVAESLLRGQLLARVVAGAPGGDAAADRDALEALVEMQG
jgi:sugar/nucleoside kinase (ribokinase family)